jgi:hypothetical protein
LTFLFRTICTGKIYCSSKAQIAIAAGDDKLARERSGSMPRCIANFKGSSISLALRDIVTFFVCNYSPGITKRSYSFAKQIQLGNIFRLDILKQQF